MAGSHKDYFPLLLNSYSSWPKGLEALWSRFKARKTWASCLCDNYISLPSNLKRPGYIEAKMDIPPEEISACGGDKARFGHGLGIGQVKLEDMAAGFDVKTNGQGIVSVVYLLSQTVEVFRV